MKLAVLICRILLGLLFVFAGASGFIIINHPPPMPGAAGQFQQIFFASRWVLMVDTVELVCGLLLLVNRYVPLALVTLAAVFANIFAFHITMMPSGLPPGIIAFALWVVCAWPFKDAFAALFRQRYS